MPFGRSFGFEGVPSHPATATLDRVSVRRGGRLVLRDVSLVFPERSVTVVVGPSGVGKTTLMGVLNGLLVPTSGSVSFTDIGSLADAAALREARRQTATIFQDHALIGRLPAIDNVLLGLADTRHPLSPLPWSREARRLAAKALDDVGLLDCATRRTASLSGGERQRVGIARALIRAPRLLLGDEPFASVDSALARQLGDQFRRLVSHGGLTVVLVLHQLQLARSLADRIVGLSDGEVVFDRPAAVFDDAAEARIFPSTLSGADVLSPPDRKDSPCCVV